MYVLVLYNVGQKFKDLDVFISYNWDIRILCYIEQDDMYTNDMFLGFLKLTNNMIIKNINFYIYFDF